MRLNKRLFALGLCFLAVAAQGSCVIINIVAYSTGTGLDVDKSVLRDALEQLGCTVNTLEGWGEEAPTADVNIFVQRLNPLLYPFAEKNWFIPNPEWYDASQDELASIDLILCRTQEVQRIFKNLKKKTFLLGFTTQDSFQASAQKDFGLWLHTAARSFQKGTRLIIKSWSLNPTFPHLTLMRWVEDAVEAPPMKNFELITKKIPLEDLTKLQNKCGVHLCLSETEGYGHYIAQAMACGSVVITTDAPPMNEFIEDKRCLVPFSHTSQQGLATNYHVEAEAVTVAVEKLLHLTTEELTEIGKKNRSNFLKRRRFFKKQLKVLVERIGE